MLDQLTFIEQQLAQRKVKVELQRFMSLPTQNGQLYYTLFAYNELLFLTNAPALPIGTRIISDTNSLEIDSNQSSLEAIEEFSGLIEIFLPENPSRYPVIEFIQILT
ncbi:MAG: hypothetical protein CFE24_14925 [Flavobacterium sp. BFFFF2]|nr:MAG: hypothetical protein CFE24_14925 [Flavobacterium sp. BFFFF2]